MAEWTLEQIKATRRNDSTELEHKTTLMPMRKFSAVI